MVAHPDQYVSHVGSLDDVQPLDDLLAPLCRSVQQGRVLRLQCVAISLRLTHQVSTKYGCGFCCLKDNHTDPGHASPTYPSDYGHLRQSESKCKLRAFFKSVFSPPTTAGLEAVPFSATVVLTTIGGTLPSAPMQADHDSGAAFSDTLNALLLRSAAVSVDDADYIHR